MIAKFQSSACSLSSTLNRSISPCLPILLRLKLRPDFNFHNFPRRKDLNIRAIHKIDNEIKSRLNRAICNTSEIDDTFIFIHK